MNRFDPQAFAWEYRASLRSPHYADALMASLPKPCDEMLDAGCGGGRLTVRLAAQAKFVTGLDLSETMLAFAQERQVVMNQHNITWVRGDLHDIPFPSHVFNCVVSTYALHHLDLDRTLPELKRVTKPGGRLLLQDMPFPSPIGKRSFYHYRFALRVSAKALATVGVRSAWQVAVQQSRYLLDRRRIFRALWTRERVRDACSRHLPGWQFVQGPEILMLWDNA